MICSNYVNNVLSYVCTNNIGIVYGDICIDTSDSTNIETRRETLNKEFERCCRFLAEMMEKYGAQVMRDIIAEIQYETETWHNDAKGRFRFVTYALVLVKRFENVV